MDSLTQAVLGAGIQGALLGRSQGRKALLYGALLGTLPDLDVLRSYPDPVSLMTHHRGFSHSVFVLSAFAGALAWLIRKKWPDAPYSAARLFVTLWLVLVTHPVLDAFTTYGTQLFWPIPVTPVSLSSIFIIDPVYTLPLLIAVVIAAIAGPTGGARKALAWMLMLSSAYLLVSLAGRWYATDRVEAALRGQGVDVTSPFATPMPFNTLLWRVLAKDAQGHYYEAISGWFDRSPPETLRLPLNGELAQILGAVPQHARLAWFTDGWLRYDVIGDDLVVSDLRMGIPGRYSFRFVMAERHGGNWSPVLPRVWPGDRGGWPEMQQVLRRIVSADPPLPLAQWARHAVRP